MKITEWVSQITQETVNIINQITETTLQEITNTNNYYTEVNEATGLVDPDSISFTFNDSNRKGSLAPVDTSFIVWAFGTRLEITATQTATIDDTEGYWYFYLTTAGVLQCSQTVWDLAAVVPIATVYWSGGTGTVDPVPPDVKKNQPYIIAGFRDTLGDAQVFLVHVVPSGGFDVTLKKKLPESSIICLSGSEATADNTFTIYVNDVSKGTAVIEDGETVGYFTFTATVTLEAGDVVKIVNQETADATLANVAISLFGTR